MNVLYIDDSSMLLSAIHSVLTRAGHDVTITESAIEGISLAKEHDYDLILCDHDMPEMSGTKVFDHLSPKNKKKFALFTGGSSPSPNGRLILKGMMDSKLFLNKIEGMHNE